MLTLKIIIAEATGEVSQTFQTAPFDDLYFWNNASDVADIADLSISKINTYRGGVYQESVSVLTQLPDRIYASQDKSGVRGGQFGTFQLEWYADFENRENGYISWGIDGKRSWTVRADSIGPNPRTEIGRRIIPEEPMSMVSRPRGVLFPSGSPGNDKEKIYVESAD